MTASRTSRAIAINAIRDAVSVGGWIIGAILIAAVVGMVVDFSIRNDGFPLPGVLVAVAVFSAAFSAVAIRPSLATIAGFLVVGGASVFAFQIQLLGFDPSLGENATYLVNRLVLVLVLVASASRRTMSSMILAAAGFLVGSAATVASAVVVGAQPILGYGGGIVLVVSLTITTALAALERATARRLPDLDLLESDAMVEASNQRHQERTAALIHDTLLSDLAAIMNSAGTLDDTMRERLRADVARLEQRRGSSAGPVPERGAEDPFRRFTALVDEYRWQGLTVDLSGAQTMPTELPHGALDALDGALRACFDNVLAHAGVDSVEVSVDSSGDAITVTVVDHGRGSDQLAVARDRLGLRSSVVGRVEGVGGAVRLWSTPGVGTSVLLTVPHGRDSVAH